MVVLSLLRRQGRLFGLLVRDLRRGAGQVFFDPLVAAVDDGVAPV